MAEEGAIESEPFSLSSRLIECPSTRIRLSHHVDSVSCLGMSAGVVTLYPSERADEVARGGWVG